MATLNKVMLIGNLTRDPEMRVTPKGSSICQLGLAINRQFKDESGAQRDETTFIDAEAWGKTAELIGKYLSKGSPCFVEGRLKLDQWDDKQSGQKRSKLKVVIEQVQFLGKPKDSTTANDGGRPQQASQSMYEDEGPRHEPKSNPATVSDDIPF